MHQEWGPKENERVHAWFYTEWHTATVRRVFHKADGPHPGLHAEVLWDSEYSTSELPTWWLVAEKRASMALPPSEPTPSNVETEAPRPQSDHPATGGPVLLAPSGKPFAPPPGLEGMNQTWNLLESPKDSDQGGHMEPDVSSTQAAPIELKKPQTCSSRAPPKGHVANVPPVPPPSVPPTIEVARPLRKRAEGPSDPELRAFVKNWSLSESSRKFLKGLPGFVQQEVVNNFRPGTTVGIDPILHTFARRIWDAKCDAVDLESFVENWGLDQQTAEYLDSLPLDLQKQVVRGFHPPSEEKRPMDIQIRRFAHSIADKLHIPLPRERSNSGTSSMATTKATETGGSTPAERDGADGTPAAAPARAPAPTQPRTEPKVWNQQEDALVRDLKNEILELRKQLEQAKEKHDDEALKEIADHLEASHAIVAAQTRDWVGFEEENAELSKKRARSFIRSSSHEMFPYLANHSEDPHLCFKLVMHVPEGKEQSLGADISSDFRLPPALGVCETTGYIRNQGGCLTLRPAAAPSGRSGRFASIEVNGNKLSREQKLHHLDCVLFGRSTSFYVFLQHASAEEVDERLRASRADMEDWDGRITQPLVDKILGEARSKDPAEVKLAREYCDLLRGQNRDSEGELMLRAFMCQARRARVKVDEANELTRCVRPSSGLHFELAAQAPVLSYGFYRCANLPELCVRLVRRTRFRAAVRKVMAQLKKQNLIQAAVRSFLPAKSESFSSDYQLLSTWTLPKFYARLEMMYEVRQNQLDDPSIKLEKLDKWKDPWAECGVAEVEALQEEHRLQIEDLRDRNRKRETEIQEAAQQQLQRLQEELKAANAELLRRNDKPREVEAEGRPTPPGFNGAQAPGLVARCLELGKANKALLESLCVEQREGFEP